MSGIRPDEAVLEAVEGRRSIRRFLPTPVPAELVLRIIRAAARAPSGQNMQPWLIHFVTGESRVRLCHATLEAAERGDRSEEYAYFPHAIREPYLSRRRKVGFDLFALHGVDRSDLAGRGRVAQLNYDFFGAPVGLFFTMERNWGFGAWIDLGMIMMNVMTLARGFGLETCPQQSWCEYGAAVRRVLNVPASQVIVSGMALGHADYAAKENSLRTERAPIGDIVVCHQ